MSKKKTTDQNGCFGAVKDETWCSITEMNPEIMSCYVYDDRVFRRMVRTGKCGTKGCPFYKQDRNEVRLD